MSFRPPLIFATWRPPWFVSVNALARGEVPSTITPAPLPARIGVIGNPEAPPPNHLRGWSDPTKFLLIGQDKLPHRQRDWPVPRGAYSFDLRGWLDQTKRLLIGQDQLPVRTGGADNPRGPLYSVDLRSWTNPGITSATASDMPTRVGVQGNPDVPLAASTLRGWEQPTGQQLIGQDQLPVRQQEWPVPRGAYSFDLRGWIVQTPQALLVVQTPFAQADWPNPRTPAAVVRDWLYPSQFQLIGQDQLPIRTGGVDNPRAPLRSIDLNTWIGSITANLQAPFAQADWPNPRVATGAVRDWQQATQANLIGQDQLPIRTGGADNPRAPLRSIDLNTWTAGVTASPSPFAQGDWPNPRTPVSAVRDWQQATPTNLIGQDQLPVRTGGADNPRAPLQPSDLRSVPTNTLPLTAVAATIPTRVGAAGNPERQPPGSISLLTWVNLGTPILLPPPPPAPFEINYFVTPYLVPARQDWIVQSQFPVAVVADMPTRVGAADNPLGPLYPINLRTWLDQTKRLLIGQDQLPVRTGGADNPRGPPRAGDPFSAQNTLPLTAVVASMPTRIGAADNPLAPLRPIDLITCINQGQILYQPQTPVAQNDWPNPKGSSPRQDWQQASAVNLIGQDQLPVRAGSIENPRGVLQPIDLRTLLARTVQFIGQDQLPVRTGGIDNPRAPLRSPQDFIGPTNLPLATAPPIVVSQQHLLTMMGVGL